MIDSELDEKMRLIEIPKMVEEVNTLLNTKIFSKGRKYSIDVSKLDDFMNDHPVKKLFISFWFAVMSKEPQIVEEMIKNPRDQSVIDAIFYMFKGWVMCSSAKQIKDIKVEVLNISHHSLH